VRTPDGSRDDELLRDLRDDDVAEGTDARREKKTAKKTAKKKDTKKKDTKKKKLEDALSRERRERAEHSGDIDQLLDDPPETDYHRGRFAGYEAGSRVRRFVFVGLGLATIGAVITGYLYISYQHEHRLPVHAMPLPEGTDISSRPRTMTWSSGKARLGLTREPPGLLAIELPDRVVRLAEGCDSAQVRLEVKDGETVEMLVIFGEIEQVPR